MYIATPCKACWKEMQERFSLWAGRFDFCTCEHPGCDCSRRGVDPGMPCHSCILGNHEFTDEGDQ